MSPQPASSLVDIVCRHLALVAIDGATDEVALTLAPGFRLHIDGLDTDRWGYLSLIEANHAAHATRPPLDVLTAWPCGEHVSLRLEPRCIMHVRIRDGVLVEMWITSDWHIWSRWLTEHTTL